MNAEERKKLKQPISFFYLKEEKGYWGPRGLSWVQNIKDAGKFSKGDLLFFGIIGNSHPYIIRIPIIE